jgi:hypothetical protein
MVTSKEIGLWYWADAQADTWWLRWGKRICEYMGWRKAYWKLVRIHCMRAKRIKEQAGGTDQATD